MIMSTKEICKRGLSMTISLTLGNSVFPFADGLVGDPQLVRRLLLGHAPGLPQRRQIRPGLFRVHRPPSSLLPAYRKPARLTIPRLRILSAERGVGPRRKTQNTMQPVNCFSFFISI